MISRKVKYWSMIAIVILMSPISLTLSVLMFLHIALINMSWKPAIEFWREWVF